MLWAVLLAQLWTSYRSGDEIFHGNWQSCREDEGYGERVYDHCVLGKCDWSLHMGPRNEFALFPYPQGKLQAEEAEDRHDTDANLLGPRYTVDQEYGRGRRSWSFPRFKISVSIVLGGGSIPECESFFVLVSPLRSR